MNQTQRVFEVFQEINGDELVLHLNCPLPVIFDYESCGPFSRRNYRLTRFMSFESLADQAVRTNGGRQEVEFSREACRDFLYSALYADGVEGVILARRYSIRIRCGVAFDKSEIAETIAQAVRIAFYPEHSLVVKRTVPKLEKLDFELNHDSNRNPKRDLELELEIDLDDPDLED